MNNTELVTELKKRVEAGTLDIATVKKTLEESSKTDKQKEHTKLLYIIGAAIVILGVLILIAQLWSDISTTGRITITLGMGLLLTFLGTLLVKQKPKDVIGSVFHFIGGFLIPGGVVTLFLEFEVDEIALGAAAFFAVTNFYIILNTTQKKAVLTFFAIANATITVYLTLGTVLENIYMSAKQESSLVAYTTMALGISYVLAGQRFKETWNFKLTNLLFFFGTAAFYVAAFTKIEDDLPWLFLYFLLLAGGMYLSVYLRSRDILIVTTIAMIGYVSYITSEFFANSIGWPFSLILLGFVFIGLGYTSVTINNRFIKRKKPQT